MYSRFPWSLPPAPSHQCFLSPSTFWDENRVLLSKARNTEEGVNPSLGNTGEHTIWPLSLIRFSFHGAGRVQCGGDRRGPQSRARCHSACFLGFICWEDFFLFQTGQKVVSRIEVCSVGLKGMLCGLTCMLCL